MHSRHSPIYNIFNAEADAVGCVAHNVEHTPPPPPTLGTLAMNLARRICVPRHVGSVTKLHVELHSQRHRTEQLK